MSKITQNRVVSTDGPNNSELRSTVFIAENDGDYGAVVLPNATQAIVVNDINVTDEATDVESKIKTNTNDKANSIRLREQTKVKITADIHTGDAATEKWAVHSLLKRGMGGHESIAVLRPAKAMVQDPKAVLAGLKIESAASLSGSKGNFSKVKFVNGGPTGTETAVKTGLNLTITYYNDSVIDDVTTAVNLLSDFVADDDGIGNSASDKMIDLLASNGMSSGQEVRLQKGSEIGQFYSNEVAPSKDLVLVSNSEKFGNLITGLAVEKWGFSQGNEVPQIEFELSGRKSRRQYQSTVKTNVTAATKIYVNDAKRFKFDADVPSYICIIHQDKRTVKYEGLKIMSADVDGGGYFITVPSNVTCLMNDHVVFYEPSQATLLVNTHSGLSGSLQINGIDLGTATNFKFDASNNLQWFDNHIFTNTLDGYTSSKEREYKFTVDADFSTAHIELYNDMADSKIVPMAFQFTMGKVAGSILQMQGYEVTFKKPNIAGKKDGVSTVQLEGTIRTVWNGPSLSLLTK